MALVKEVHGYDEVGDDIQGNEDDVKDEEEKKLKETTPGRKEPPFKPSNRTTN